MPSSESDKVWGMFNRISEADIWRYFRQYMKAINSGVVMDWGHFMESIIQFNNQHILVLSDILKLEQSDNPIDEVLLAICIYSNTSKLTKLKFISALYGRVSKGSLTDSELHQMISHLCKIMRNVTGERLSDPLMQAFNSVKTMQNENFGFDDVEKIFLNFSFPLPPYWISYETREPSCPKIADPRLDPAMRERFMRCYNIAKEHRRRND
jgi:hypothetical protein